MQDREKKLAMGLAAIVVAWFGLPMFESWFLQPITQKNGELTTVEASVEKLTDLQTQLKLAERSLDNWQYESLPPNPYTAQREYSEWLMDLARMSGFTKPELSLGNVPSRGQIFNEIPVTIEAKATLEQLARFLYHFDRVALLHRVQSLDIKSPASIGQPMLDFTLVASGIAMVDAPQRTQLFPSTTLTEAVDADQTTLAIEPVKGFPLIDGFHVKLNEEFAVVRKLDERIWTVTRGAEETMAAAYEAGSAVEYFPVDQPTGNSQGGDQQGRGPKTFEDYLSLLENNPFTKPSPPVDYKPELSPTSPQIVTRGTEWKLPMKLTGWDPSGGPAIYRLGEDAPSGLEIDAKSGELTWNADKDVEAMAYEVAVIATSEVLSGQQVEIVLPITLREPNLPPTIEPVENLQAYSGRPFTVDLKADDPDGENEALVFAITGEVPTGAAIDEKTGTLQWTPPLTLELGEYKLTVTITDSGDPAQTVTQEVTVKVEDDAALFTFLSGYFEKNGKPQAMLTNRADNSTSMVNTDSPVKAADVDATILTIKPNFVLLKIGDETFRLDMGKNLRQMTPVEAEDG